MQDTASTAVPVLVLVLILVLVIQAASMASTVPAGMLAGAANTSSAATASGPCITAAAKWTHSTIEFKNLSHKRVCFVRQGSA